MKFPIEMYRIRRENIFINVPCERCQQIGYINPKCNVCGGKGIHRHSLPVWRVVLPSITIEKIDRVPQDDFYTTIQPALKNTLRYWTSCCEYFNDVDLLIHFTKEQAQKECDKRNVEIQHIIQAQNKITPIDEQGRWIYMGVACGENVRKCSQCNTMCQASFISAHSKCAFDYIYCPYCGSKMNNG